MDYALYFVTNFKGEHDAIVEVQNNINEVNSSLATLTETVS
jgi:hypothetical protein